MSASCTRLVLLLTAGLGGGLATPFPGLPVLQFEKICPSETVFSGSPVATRYFGNDCLVETQLNSSRNAAHDLNIVVMAPGIGANGDMLTQAEPYVSMAMQHIEDSGLLPGYRMNAYMADSLCTAPDATANIIRAMSTGPPKHGIMGDGCSIGCVAVNDAMQYFNVLQVSHTCTSVALSDHTRHPFFARLAPNFRNSVITIRQVIQLFSWKRVGLIAGWRSINTLGRDIFLEMAQIDIDSGAYDWKILMSASAPDQAGAQTSMAEALQKDARVITNYVYEDMGAHLMCEAYKLGMYSPKWIQISASGWWATGFLQVVTGNTDCTVSQLQQAGFGWLLGNPHGGYIDSSEKHGLSGVPVSTIYEDYNRECVKFFNTTLGCNANGHPSYFYDGMWMFAIAMHNYLIEEGHAYEELNTPQSRERLFNLSLEVDFLGITGRVRLFNYVEPTTADYLGSIGDREGPSGIRQFVGPPEDALLSIGYRLPNNTLVWLQDVEWSATQRVSCASGVCDLENGWIPADSGPEDCPSNTVWFSETGCTECPAGERANGTQCIPCDGGTAASTPGQAACTPCAPGKFSKLLGSIGCTDCATGRFSAAAGAIECDPCELGGYADQEGLANCTPCFGQLVTTVRGATSETECVCPGASYRPLNAEPGTCERCPEGIECGSGTDMNSKLAWPVVKEGYYADVALSVFNCLDEGRRCRRGLPGESCADGRRGRVCFECVDGKAPNSDGTCQACEPGADVLPLILILLACLLVVVGGYYVFDTADFTKQSHHILLIAMTLSLLITMFQQLGALAVVSIAWPGPMNAVFQMLSVLAFDLEALKVNCVVQPRPAFSFAMRVLMFAACVLVIVIVHIFFVIFRRGGHFRERNPILISGIGTVLLVFYVSVFISILAPVQCAENPNRTWTVKQYPAVICWEGDDDHTSMLIVGALAALVPISFLGECCRVIWVLPKKMGEANVAFLQSYAFLFFRYKPAMYWYSLVHLFRSLLIALTTIMPIPGVQVLLLQVVLALQLALVCDRHPWRVPQANTLESELTVGVLLMLGCAALITGGGEERMAIAWTFIALLIAACFACFVVAIHGFYRVALTRKRKLYDFFICHHKAATGCMARLINIDFNARGKKAFIDTDDLRDLDRLFDFVATQTGTLVILCSKFIYTRPWCMGEVVTAYHWKVNIFKVLRADFVEPDEEFIESYLENVGGDIGCLAECGIDMGLISETLQEVSVLPGCILPKVLSASTMRSLCNSIAKREIAYIEFEPHETNLAASVVLIADSTNQEAACTSYVLVQMLVEQLKSADVVPLVLVEQAKMPPKASLFLLLCTSGVLTQTKVLFLLAELQKRTLPGLPVVADESFVFPDQSYYDDKMKLLQNISDQPKDLSIFVLAIFKAIATIFQPNNYGSTREVLDAKAKELATRLEKGGHPSSEVVVRSGLSGGISHNMSGIRGSTSSGVKSAGSSGKEMNAVPSDAATFIKESSTGRKEQDGASSIASAGQYISIDI